MWSVVDAHRRCADELEQTLRELTGDRPVPEVDKIELHNQLIVALTEARSVFYTISDREGHTIRRPDANRCRSLANRCGIAIRELQKLGEL